MISLKIFSTSHLVTRVEHFYVIRHTSYHHGWSLVSNVFYLKEHFKMVISSIKEENPSHTCTYNGLFLCPSNNHEMQRYNILSTYFSAKFNYSISTEIYFLLSKKTNNFIWIFLDLFLIAPILLMPMLIISMFLAHHIYY